MIYYYSSPFDSFPSLYECNIRTMLISYAYKNELKKIEKHIKNDEYWQDKEKIKIMVDSGAFSIFNSGKQEIDVYEYKKFIEEFTESIYDKVSELTFVNLDVIPKDIKNKSDVDRAVETGIKNLDILSENMDKDMLMPVWHDGDSLEAIDYFVENGYNYIGIGMHFQYLLSDYLLATNRIYKNKDDIKKFRLHGLGLTKEKIIKQIPFYSIDSISYKKFYFNQKNTGQFWIGNKLLFSTEKIYNMERMLKQVTDLWKIRNEDVENLAIY